MAIETLQSHVMVALMAKNDLPNLWLSMGQTTPWPDEEIPPVETMDTDHLDGITGFKHFERALLVAPLSSDVSAVPVGNEIVYKGNQWKIVADADAYTEGARYLYLETHIEPGDLPYVVYRQIGVYRNLTPKTGYTANQALVPQQVDDPGMLMGYDNRLFQRYANNVTILEQIIIKF